MLAKVTRAARLSALPVRSNRALSTVVEDEVRKFDAASSDWWAPKSTTGVGPLHQINPVRVKYIRSHVIEHFGHTTDDDPMPLHGLRVADVGCGGGILSEALCRIGGNMVSVDPGTQNIAAAKQHAAMNRHTSSIDYRCCTSDDLVAQGEQFDVVCSLEVIEHVSDVQAFLHSLTPLVKPGGLLFVSSINRTALSAALAIGAAEYVMRIVPPGTHDWNKCVQPSELEVGLRQDGFTVKNVSGIVGDPIFRSWHIHPTCHDVNYIMCASKPQQ
ncbi:hypothetical protein BBJ29_005685 [Phytophthora kernoviae]|uniref:Ubiquinone biosynthesis O-methyltransferase, mitochondrial n=1 Tax=Phytophthora kernoviae TaxID=325452 RepID=A0A3F2S0I8_9STRA|nr:hypothetical protein BBJ29_005685 [Phytophthora kernoviae]RLN67855.1 hypothetical protein BBP00_00001390 [Phytophthora kernoviae]